MKHLMIWTTLVLMTVTGIAQVYSYRDTSGKLVLTDTPGSGRKLVSGTGRKKTTSTSSAQSSTATPIVSRDAGIEQLIRQYAAEYGLEEQLLRAVIKAESDFDHRAVSHKGAMGLMQLMPETGKSYGVEDFFDPEENIRAGAQHLSRLIDRYFGDYELALAAYNAGETTVDRYDGIPPYKETQDYVRKIMNMVQSGRASGSSGKTQDRTIYRYVDEHGRICLTNIYPSGNDTVEVVRP